MCYLLLRAVGIALCAICRILGVLLCLLSFERRCVVFNNLRRTYLHMGPLHLRLLALHNAARLIELALLPLAMAFFSRRRIGKDISICGDWDGLAKGRHPRLLLISHHTLSEALTFVNAIKGGGLPIDAVVLYRPFKSAALDACVRRSRSRFAVRPFPRNSSIVALCKLLRRGNCVALLYDQYAGAAEVQTMENRVAIATALPEMLVKYSSAEIFTVTIERTGFWRGRMLLEPLVNGGGYLTILPIAILKINC
jgi:lauroyl/myristoyl acyltransferase